MTFRSLLRLVDRPRYLAWQVTGRKHDIMLQGRQTGRFHLRASTPTHNDLGVFYEVFAQRCYAVPPTISGAMPARVERILDLGANCGATLLWWRLHYPQATILAFEAHPGNAAAAQANVRLNAADGLITVRAEAVSSAPGRAKLSDRGAGASMFYRNAQNYLDVPVVDLFSSTAGQRFDLMKIDIEGAEFAILDDPRFPALAPPALVMEWHEVGRPGAQQAVYARLGALGYRVHDLEVVAGSHGVLWAVRPGHNG
jgi:FkbM family methyltransferase